MRWASALANWRAVRDDSDASVAGVQQLNLNALVTIAQYQRELLQELTPVGA
jgi:hypothetical protein